MFRRMSSSVIYIYVLPATSYFCYKAWDIYNFLEAHFSLLLEKQVICLFFAKVFRYFIRWIQIFFESLVILAGSSPKAKLVTKAILKRPQLTEFGFCCTPLISTRIVGREKAAICFVTSRETFPLERLSTGDTQRHGFHFLMHWQDKSKIRIPPAMGV